MRTLTTTFLSSINQSYHIVKYLASFCLLFYRLCFTMNLSGGDVNEFKAAAALAIGCITVAILSMWYSTGVGDAVINLWRQL